MLAGKAAVELKYGRLDVGAVLDIDRASAIVHRFIVNYAASGFALFYHANCDNIESAHQHDEITTERNAMLARCYEEAKDILRKNWAFVEKLAAALVERNTLVFEEIAELRKGMAA